ncbi:MAG: hypothetical protein HYT34_01225 [Candidatus Ryanbacteria bacterium]|nr:hypothetical protein [Candidatus Ryanbacteria bacterium]
MAYWPNFNKIEVRKGFTPLEKAAYSFGRWLCKRWREYNAPKHPFLTGFTLLETLVAIYVILFGLVSFITLSTESLKAVSVFRSQLIATNLAQEGLELVRNKRDTNFLILKNSGICTPATSCDATIGCDPNIGKACLGFPPIQNFQGLANQVGDPCLSTGPSQGCRIRWLDTTTGPENDILTFEPCDNAAPSVCKLLRECGGFYSYDPNPDPNVCRNTAFDRRILITPLGTTINPADPAPVQQSRIDMKVESIVTWQDRFGSRSITLKDYLTNNRR